MARIMKDDTVIVITGRDKGKEGRVLRTDPRGKRVWVQGLNLVFKHMRKSQDHPQGARIQKEAALHVSNVMLKDPKTGKPTRIRYQLDPKGKRTAKQRVSVISGTVIEKPTQ